MKRLFGYKYHKIITLGIIIILCYIVFSQPQIKQAMTGLDDFGYIGIFIAGLFFSLGFTSPISLAILVLTKPENIFLAALVGGSGALISNLALFNVIRVGFTDEFENLKNTHPMKALRAELNRDLSKRVKNYLMYAFAGFMISSPLPDEIGVVILSGLAHVKQKMFALITFFLSTFGIFVILYLAR
jgi:hypothetical protein